MWVLIGVFNAMCAGSGFWVGITGMGETIPPEVPIVVASANTFVACLSLVKLAKD